jgi:RNA-binding protein YhbY
MLTAAERRALKGKAHKLQPVVRIGAKALTDEVVGGKVVVIYRKSP